MAESVERRHPVRKKGCEQNSWSSQIKDLPNLCVLLPSQALGITRIGQGLVGSVSGSSDIVGYQVMVLVARSPSGAAL